MKLFVTLSKRTLGIILALLIIAFIVIGQIFSSQSNIIDGSTNALRVSYIKSLGIDADDSAVSSKNIIIPEQFGDVYKKYNILQKKAGFDLSDYKSEDATVYTYPILDSTNEIHLIVKDGHIIGGDISSAKFDGEMLPLKEMK